MNRQEYWKSKGYTDEQIQSHLSFERFKNKQARERNKKNNESNKEIIAQIKEDLLGKTFKTDYRSNTILSIRPTNDGRGFWFKTNTVFSDKSHGEFRYF